MDNIKVSIIVPVYNVGLYLSRCLDSLTNQTLETIEIIVVNDCTLDNSQIIIDDYAKVDRRIVSIINDQNIGQGLSRQKGIELARGEYITFVDSDDYIEQAMYYDLYHKAKEKDYDVVGSDLTYIFPNGESELNAADMDKIHLFGFRYILDALIAPTHNFTPNSLCDKLYRTDFIKSNRILLLSERTCYLEDLTFNIEFFVKRPTVAWINKSYYNYVIRNDSTMYSYQTHFKERYLFMHEKHLSILDDHNLSDFKYVVYLNKRLFEYTFTFVANGLASRKGIVSKVKEVFSIILNSNLKCNLRQYTIMDIPLYNNALYKRIFKKIVFLLMKYI